MRKQPSVLSGETPQEDLLRATLSEHAPKTIELDNAWAVVAERLPSLRQQTQHSKRISFLPLLSYSSRSNVTWWRRMPTIAAIVVLSIFLMGASLAGGIYYFGWGGLIANPRLSQDINQQQTVDSITITVTRAYADSGATLIAYDMHMPANRAKNYNDISVLTFSLTDQKGEEAAAGNIECYGWSRDGSPLHCIMTSGPFHLSAGVTKLTITLDMLKVVLIRPNGLSDIHTGLWHFQFDVIFHQKRLSPNFPMAVPTTMP